VVTKKIPLEERIIFALDYADPELAKSWVARLDDRLRFFKVGLQLFLAGGWPVVEYILGRGNKVMLDLKFYDIPETVRLAVNQVRDRGVSFLTVHGNGPIMEAAARDKGDVKILAVTVLTSFDEADMAEMGLEGSVADLVITRAQKAMQCGCDGIVSSAREVAMLRQHLGNGFYSVTPGIRPLDHGVADDQRRVVTPAQAIENGADYLVIGRPIRNAADPLQTIAAIQQEIAPLTGT